jgi:DICT domain-containing protein
MFPFMHDSDKTKLPSLFNLLRQQLGDSLTPALFSKASLVDLSHILEDLVLTKSLPALVLTGFQESNYWKKEIKRYFDLAQIATTICIFAAGKLPPESEHNIFVQLQPDDQMRQEWFLVIVTHHFSILLCGLDNFAEVSDEVDRTFETIFSFDPQHVNIALDILELALEKRNPARLEQLRTGRAKFTPSYPEIDYLNEIVTRFTNHLHQYHAASKELAKERVIRMILAGIVHETSQPITALILTLQMAEMGDGLQPGDLEFITEAVLSLKDRIDRLQKAVNYEETTLIGTEFLEVKRDEQIG